MTPHTAAMLVSQKYETAATLVSLWAVELLATLVKTLYKAKF